MASGARIKSGSCDPARCSALFGVRLCFYVGHDRSRCCSWLCSVSCQSLVAIVLLFTLLHSGQVAALADGYYDSTWAGAGRITFNPDTQNASASTSVRKILVTPAGNLALSGGVSNLSTGNNYWWLGELTAAGAFAGSFGIAGSGTATECQFGFACAQHYDTYQDAMLQPDGKTLFVGFPYLSRTNAMATSFDAGVVGGTGQVSEPFFINDHLGYVDGRTAAPAAGGKVYIAGTGAYDPKDSAPNLSFGVARLNSDLSIDSTFNASGPNSDGVTFAGGVYIDIGPTAGGAEAAFVQNDGRLLLVGRTMGDANGYGDMLLARLNTDGSLDTSFAAGEGIEGISPLPESNLLLSIALSSSRGAFIDRGGRIVLGVTGYDTLVGLQGILVGRLNPDGSMDDTFYDHGWVFAAPVTACPGGNVVVSAATIDSAGRVLVAGRCDDDFFVARFRGDSGAPDASFGINGISLGLFDPALPYSYVNTIVMDSSGHPVVGGWVPLSSNRAGVARLTYDLIYTNDFELAPRGCLPPDCN